MNTSYNKLGSTKVFRQTILNFVESTEWSNDEYLYKHLHKHSPVVVLNNSLARSFLMCQNYEKKFSYKEELPNLDEFKN